MRALPVVARVLVRAWARGVSAAPIAALHERPAAPWVRPSWCIRACVCVCVLARSRVPACALFDPPAHAGTRERASTHTHTHA
eukprot:8531125-Alexandrium_andersonii.AAC.1